MSNAPELYIFAGLPASGKSTLARFLAREVGAIFIRIDSIEEAILAHGNLVGPEGYEAAYKIAGDNLDLGLSVVADSVNPIEVTRSAWKKVAGDRGIKYHEIEIVCSDKTEHRQRLEMREANSQNARIVRWEDVIKRQYEPLANCFVFDTAGETPEESQERFKRELNLSLNIYNLVRG